MLTIRKAPPYIAKLLCENAGLEYDENKFYYAAREEWKICGFCEFKLEDKTAVITYAYASHYQILDGVVRASIAGGEDMGAVYYDFEVSDEVAKTLLPIGFRKSQGTSGHSIEKLFSVCKGCSKQGE